MDPLTLTIASAYSWGVGKSLDSVLRGLRWMTRETCKGALHWVDSKNPLMRFAGRIAQVTVSAETDADARRQGDLAAPEVGPVILAPAGQFWAVDHDGHRADVRHAAALADQFVESGQLVLGHALSAGCGYSRHFSLPFSRFFPVLRPPDLGGHPMIQQPPRRGAGRRVWQGVRI